MPESTEIPIILNKPKELVVPPEAEHLIQACGDLSDASTETNTQYLVAGSVAYVCAVGELYRTPGDVDCWYDINNAELFRDNLKQKGYTHTIIDDPENSFPNPLEHFEKGESVIEARGANFTDRGIEYPVRIPLPKVPVEKRPIGNLITTKLLAEPQEYNFGGVILKIPSKEALLLGLRESNPLIKFVGDKVDKRMMDLDKLSLGVDEELIKKMIAEKPGLYLGKTPLVTSKNKGLFNLFLTGAKFKRKLRNNPQTRE